MAGTVRSLGVGGPRSPEVEALGRDCGCTADNDLRRLLVDRPAAYLLVTSMCEVKIADLRGAVDAGTRVLCLEPPAAELSEVDACATPGHPGAIRFLPAFSSGPGMRAAADPDEAHASPSLVRFSSLGRSTEGSLLARLIDGWVTVLGVGGLPETIDAQIHHPEGLPSREMTPRTIAGWATAHGRVAGGGGVVVEASDRALVRRRELNLLNTEADFRVDDTTYRLQRNNRETTDEDTGSALDRGGDPAAALSYVDLIADQWRQWIDRPLPPTPPGVTAQALACVHACLLSARTGQPERPDKLLRLR